MDLAEQLQLIDEHPELAPLVDLSAPVWCQLGTHDRLVFDLSAERHGSVDHKAQLYGEACVWKELGLESFPGEHRPAADVALETRLSACASPAGTSRETTASALDVGAGLSRRSPS